MVEKKYARREGESMGTYQHRVANEMYQDKYAGKTLEEMKEIQKKYEAEHPELFNGRTILFPPEMLAINRGLSEASKKQHVAKSNTDEKNAADTLSKKLTFMHVLSALNPKNWFSRSEPELTQEDIAKTEDMLRRLKVDVAPEKNFEGRFLKEFKRRMYNSGK